MGGLNIQDVVREVAPDLGIGIRPVPGYPGVMRLSYPESRPVLLFWHFFDLNPAAATDMSRVKGWVQHFLREAGFSVPEFEVFFVYAWAEKHQTDRNVAAAAAFADRLGYPLVLKPSCQSMGKGVNIVTAPDEFAARVAEVTAIDPMFLVQSLVRGTEYRVVVLDSEVKLAYQKLPFRVVGDGSATCQELIEARIADLAARGFGVGIKAGEGRIDSFLTSQGLTRDVVLPAGAVCQVSLTSGFVSGGELREGFDLLPPDVREVAPRIVRQAGLRYAGLDIIVPDDRGPGEAPYYVLDVNSGPVLGDYARLGEDQYRRVQDLVRSLLAALGKEASNRPCAMAGGS